MKVRLSRSRTVLVGVAVLLPLLLSCAGAKEAPDPAAALRTGIRAEVADPARAGQMLAAVDEIEAAVGDLDRLLSSELSAVTALVRDYGSTREAIDASLAELNARREALALRVLTAHASLKGAATAAEWKKLRKLEMDMIRFAAGKSLGQTAPFEKES